MTAYVLRRLAQVVPTILGITLVAFLLLHLMPGDPVFRLVYGQDMATITPEKLAEIRHQFGLDDPKMVQYVRFLKNAVQGNLGTSILERRPVRAIIADVLPHTLQLALASLALSIVVGLALGILAALRRGTGTDMAVMGASLFTLSMPEFWLSILLILLVSVRLGWLPAAGSATLKHLVLPALVLGLRGAASLARITRSSMLEVLGTQYVTTARAKGLTTRAVVYRHALRNALIPVVTVMGLQLGRMLSGAVVVESIFARQGIGKVLVTALVDKDFPVVQSSLLIVAGGYVVANLVVDVSYAWIDPRISYR